jgi:hypothetical protein
MLGTMQPILREFDDEEREGELEHERPRHRPESSKNRVASIPASRTLTPCDRPHEPLAYVVGGSRRMSVK